ncbi:restriction endonuclease subunit S [Lacticaseibacillus suihuaensis]
MSKDRGNQRLIPTIRFKGFTDDWEQRKSGSIFVTVSKKGHAELPVLSATQEDGMVPRANVGIDIKYDEQSLSNYKMVEPGEFVIHLRSFQGGFAYSSIQGITSPAYTVIQLRDLSQQLPEFWIEPLRSTNFIKRLTTVTYGIRDGRSISFRDFSSLKLSYPGLEEQEKIEAFFKSLNDTIALHQRKYENLQAVKKELLKRMFASDKKPVPDFRFNGYTNDWEQRKLGDAVSISSGVTGDATLQGGEYRLTRIESISQGMLNVARLGFTNEKPDQKYLLNLGDILYSNINSLSHIGKVALVDTAGIYHGINLLRFQMRNDVDSEFLFQRLNTMPMKSWAVSHANPAVSQASINQTELSKQPISSPTITEQQKIGSFFKQLDDTIALHQRKLEDLKQLKKVLLQKLFV